AGRSGRQRVEPDRDVADERRAEPRDARGPGARSRTTCGGHTRTRARAGRPAARRGRAYEVVEAALVATLGADDRGGCRAVTRHTDRVPRLTRGTLVRASIAHTTARRRRGAAARRAADGYRADRTRLVLVAGQHRGGVELDDPAGIARR